MDICTHTSLPDETLPWHGKTEDTFADDTYKYQSLKERNRHAQKKYREKLKEKEGALEETVSKLENDLQRVLLERQKLEVHNQSLVEMYESGSAVANSVLANSAEERPCIIAEEDYASALARKSGVQLTIVCDRKFTHAELESFPGEEWKKLHHLTYLKAKELLRKNPEWDPDCDAGRQLHALMREKHGIAAYVASTNRNVLHWRMKFKQEPSEQVMDIAVAAARLQNHQKRYLWEVQKLLLATWDKLSDERVKLQQQVAAIASCGEFTSGSIAGLQYRWAQIAQAIQDNVDKEHVAICRFYAMVWLPPDGLQPFQEAALLEAVYPCFPDILTLVARAAPPDDRPVLLDAEASNEMLKPAERLPDPAVDRYQPLATKMVNAIMGLQLFEDMIKGQPYARA